jgi:hypothetical protein
MIHLLNFYDYSSKFPVIRVLSHDMQTNNMSNTNQLDTHIEKIPGHSWDL